MCIILHIFICIKILIIIFLPIKVIYLGIHGVLTPRHRMLCCLSLSLDHFPSPSCSQALAQYKLRSEQQ